MNNPEDKFDTILFLPEGEKRQGEGGLRTKGHFNKSYDDKPLISIITVVFNGERYLEETIQSVINQTYENVEYIIIDGGSSDGTVDIIKKYEDRIDYWISEKDGGIYDAINKGIELASGDIVGIIHAGDFYFEDTLEHVVSSYSIYGDGLVYFGNMKILDPESTYLATRVVNTKSFFFMRSGMSVPHPSVFIPLKLYKKYGVYSLKYSIASDYDLLFRYIVGNKVDFVYIDKTLSCFELGGISFDTLRAAKESHLVRVSNGIGKFESSVYLFKSVLLHYIAIVLKAINAQYIVNFYRKYIIKYHSST